MKKSIALLLLLCSLVTLGVIGCGGANTSGGSTSTSQGSPSTANEVHMNGQQFIESSVTIHKGSRLTLIDDAAVVHVIQNGAWENGTIRPLQEPGAPKVNSQFNGNDRQTIGPFLAAGTYHLYCIVHPGMNLTVIVQ